MFTIRPRHGQRMIAASADDTGRLTPTEARERAAARLDEIAELVRAGADPAKVRALLELTRAELEQFGPGK